MFAKFSYLIHTHAISSPCFQILRRTGTSYFFNIGTHSNQCGISWLFESTSTNNKVQSFSEAKD